MSLECTATWLDGSDVRPVPDHQEVWTERAGGANRSLVLELNEALEGAVVDAVREHFEELCSVDACTGGQVVSVTPLSPTAAVAAGLGDSVVPAPAAALTGLQLLADGSRVLVSLVLLRLSKQSTDLLIVVYRALPAQQTTPVAASPDGAGDDAALAAHVRETLAVHDWGLFGAHADG